MATNGLILHPPRRYMRMESHDGMILTWEKGLGKKLSQCHFAHHKSDMD
jgi:hypothetical protein